jgi:hypothetical protein
VTVALINYPDNEATEQEIYKEYPTAALLRYSNSARKQILEDGSKHVKFTYGPRGLDGLAAKHLLQHLLELMFIPDLNYDQNKPLSGCLARIDSPATAIDYLQAARALDLRAGASQPWLDDWMDAWLTKYYITPSELMVLHATFSFSSAPEDKALLSKAYITGVKTWNMQCLDNEQDESFLREWVATKNEIYLGLEPHEAELFYPGYLDAMLDPKCDEWKTPFRIDGQSFGPEFVRLRNIVQKRGGLRSLNMISRAQWYKGRKWRLDVKNGLTDPVWFDKKRTWWYEREKTPGEWRVIVEGREKVEQSIREREMEERRKKFEEAKLKKKKRYGQTALGQSNTILTPSVQFGCDG